MKTRTEAQKRANIILEKVHEYLAECGWTICSETLFSIDPITGTIYPGDTAFAIQVGRDLC